MYKVRHCIHHHHYHRIIISPNKWDLSKSSLPPPTPWKYLNHQAESMTLETMRGDRSTNHSSFFPEQGSLISSDTCAWWHRNLSFYLWSLTILILKTKKISTMRWDLCLIFWYLLTFKLRPSLQGTMSLKGPKHKAQRLKKSTHLRAIYHPMHP